MAVRVVHCMALSLCLAVALGLHEPSMQSLADGLSAETLLSMLEFGQDLEPMQRHTNLDGLDLTPDSVKDEYTALQKLMKEKGMVGMEKLTVANVGNPPHRGMMTTKNISAGETIITIPFEGMMRGMGPDMYEAVGDITQCHNADHILKNHPFIYPPGVAHAGEVYGHRTLTMWLVHERLLGVNSSWYEYLSTLPKAFSTPTEFDDFEMSDLNGTAVMRWAIDKKEVEKEEFELIQAFVTLCRPSLKLKWSDWHWARTVVNTRAFNYDLDGTAAAANTTLANSTNGTKDRLKDICLVPFIEMANHNFVTVSWFTWDHKFFLYSEDPIKAGSEFHINYGEGLSNEDLLKHYGFVHDGNKNHLPDVCGNKDCGCILKEEGQFNGTTLREQESVESASSSLSFNSKNAKRLRLEVRHGLDHQVDRCNELEQSKKRDIKAHSQRILMEYDAENKM